MYELSLDILYYQATFSGMSKKYDALHLGDYSDEELCKARTESERAESKV